MKRSLFSLALLISVVSFASAATPPGASLKRAVSADATLSLEPVDFAKLRAEDAAQGRAGQALRYGVAFDFDNVRFMNGEVTHGEVLTLDDGRKLWRWAALAPDATSLDFGFSRFHLPRGAELYVYAPDLKIVRGPYTDNDNEKHGQLWTPVVPGEAAVVELVAPAELWPYVELELTRVNYGYLEFWKRGSTKAESCNLDAVCPEADPWRDQVRAVAAYGFGSGAFPRFCTGQLVNNTANDGRPLFLSANHCEIGANDAPSVVIYWNYESAQCRTIDTPANGQIIDPSIALTQTGSTLIASEFITDFLLLELDDEPPGDAFLGGWDRRDRVPDFSASIHHPSGDEKRIAIDDDAASIIDTPSYISSNPQPDTHIFIQNYEIGTTEGGSSGSALWNQNQRIVGWLSGGGAACSVNIGDGYGRLHKAWNVGNTPSQRLRDHLDPLGTNVQVLEGQFNCDVPDVSIQSSSNPADVGADISLTSQVSGGQGPYSYSWDLNEDGIEDWSGDSLTTRFPSRFNGSVVLTVTDSLDCSASAVLGQVARGPELAFQSTMGPQEVCGDGDARVEPGEIFQSNVSVQNAGDGAAGEGWLVFAKSMAGSEPVAGPDNAGYTAFDSDNGSCAFDFVDISSSGQGLTFTPSGQFDALDDGGASVPLDGGGFDFYGVNRTQLVMSSNGYLSTQASDNGGDFDNDCPIPTSPDRGGGARIMPMHDDLIIEGGFYQYFDNCPRSGEVGNGPCHVFQWDDVGFFSAEGVIFDMQALLYENTGQIVYQYGPGNTEAGANSSIGIQNQNASVGLSYACQQNGSVTDNKAVCIYAANNQPPTAVTDGIRLLTPAVSVGNFGPNSTSNVAVQYKIEESVACGSQVSFGAHGLTFPEGFAPGQGNVVQFTVGGQSGQCNASVNCPMDIDVISPNQGLFNSPLRDGNGVDTNINLQDTLVATWYTGRKDHLPVWYSAAAEFLDNQMDSPLRKVTRSAGGAISVEEVGRVLYTFLDESTALFNYTLNGESSGEYLTEFVFGMGGERGSGTGHYFAPAESGWGTLLNQRGNVELNTFYFYDSSGEPVWGLGASTDFAPDEQTHTLVTSQVVCPGCPFVPQQPTDPIGTVTRNFDVPPGTCPDENANDLLVSTNISLPAPLSGSWVRNDVCKEALSAPVGGN